MSSDSTQTCGWRRSTSASASNSPRLYTAPLGLPGELSSSQRVCGVIAASSCAGVILNPLSMPQSTTTGVPSATSVMSR